MANSTGGEEGDVSPTSTSAPRRRERAPTITIDTSAVSSPQDAPDGTQPPAQPRAEPEEDANPAPTTADQQQHQGQTETSANGGERSESRSASAHNISSAAPTTASRPTESSHQSQNFLSVPGTRSRGNSVDSDDGGNYNSSFAGDTCVGSSPPGEQPSRDTTPPESDVTKDQNALAPDPGTEGDFEVTDNKFAFSPGQLNKMYNPKSLAAFYALGGLRGIERGLRTNRDTGLSIDEASLEGMVSFKDATSGSSQSDSVSSKVPVRASTTSTMATGDRPNQEEGFMDRRRVFGNNKLPARKTKSIWELAWIAYNDNVLILLTAAAVVSLALGIYQAATATGDEPKVQWVEGVAIVVAIVVVVVVGAANDWKKERQFVKLNKKKEDRKVKVIRSGKSVEISVYDVLAGDVMHLEPGDLVCADGVFIEGHNVKCDESSATGESDLLRKIAGDEVYRVIESHEDLKKMDPFILSGSKISEGVGTFIVTSTGVHSSHGKTLMSLQEEGQTTPLQSKLNVLAEYIAKLGLSAGLLLFVVLFIKFLVHLGGLGSPAEKGQAFLQIFIVAVTIIVVAVPEGLPLAVTLALAFATTRMLRDNNLVRLLRACETMGNATTICSDKTGTLTQNKMKVVAGTFGSSSRFGAQRPSPPAKDTQERESDADRDVPATECVAALSADTKDLVQQSIVLNSTAFEGTEDGVPTFIGSKTETALLTFARDYLGLVSVSEERSNAEVVQLVPFDSGRKCMAVVIKLKDGRFRLLVKGASEILISKCTKLIAEPTGPAEEAPLTDEHRATFNTVITNYASRSLRTIGLVYRDFEQWPPKGIPTQEDEPNFATFEGMFREMTFLGVVGIQDPLRDGVAESVHICQKAGVFVRMVTGDNVITAKAIASECGIFTPGGIAMEGPTFRKLSSYQMKQIIPRLQVLARSSPEDKKILVSQLQNLGETVAVTGDGTNDAPALKTADVGFSMGIAGTEVAKEASAIILMDDNFNSIVKAIGWGRTVNDAVKKFLQFQITVNITAVFVTFVSAVASDDEESVLTAVQLLWVNLIMDTLAALALATDPPSHAVLSRRPEPRSAPLITFTMWKMIIGQSIYQLVVTFILNFLGKSILHYDSSDETQLAMFKSLIFNSFVWMQIFNQYNARRIDNNLNIFEGMLKNYWFIGIQFVIMAGQVLIIFVGGQAFSVHRLDGREWGVSLILGVISIPVAVIIRLIPDELIRPLFPRLWKRKPSTPQVFVSDEDRRYEWNPAIEEIRDQLTFLKKVRGGRLKNLKYKLQHPQTLLPRSRNGSRSGIESQSLPQTPTGETGASVNGGAGPTSSQSNQPPPSPDSRSRSGGRSRSNSAFGPAAAMAGIVAGSVAGWSPVDHGGGENDSLKFTAGVGHHSGLDKQEGIELHPDTCEEDPIISEYDPTSRVPPSQNPELTPVFSHAPSTNPPSHHDRQSASRHSRESGRSPNNGAAGPSQV